jgi:alkylhydroperoxidase family enzyme
LKRRFGDRVEFLAIYVREAHPTDGWRMASNDEVGIAIPQPREEGERTKVARTCCSTLQMTMPLLVDEMDDRVGHAYSGMPDRLYLIDREGRVAYKGGRGPFGFKVGELEQSLVMLLLDQERTPSKQEHVTTKAEGRLPMLTNEQAWKRLPGAPKTEQPLPAWARLLAGPLPLTTARMLELDALHRTGNRLDPKLRCLVRWAAADANGCDYAKAVAVADLKRAGVSEVEVQRLTGDPSRLTLPEQAATTFARRMMREAHAITDEEVKQLIQYFGEERVVALVLLLAHASFQDRLLLASHATVEPNGPLPPLTISFARPKADSHPPSTAPTANTPKDAKVAVGGATEEWMELQASLDEQRERPGRIRVPSRGEVLKRIGEHHPGAWQAGILWSRVCYGYQPELTDAWFDSVTAFRQEAALERVFQQCVFWVVTRSLECFY